MKKRILEKLTKRKIQVINFNDPRQEVLFVRKNYLKVKFFLGIIQQKFLKTIST